MCGRYTLYHDEEDLTELFDLEAFPLEARYNIAPTQQIPVVRQRIDGTREMLQTRWGLIPHWVKTLEGFRANLFNARSEGAAEKASFRDAMKSGRCLVPASGFYEWSSTDGGSKQPYYIRRRDGRPLALAGLMSVWTKGETPLLSSTILTTRANAVVAPLHDRMPVMLDAAAFERWLDPAVRDAANVEDLLVPYDDDALEAYPVDRAVGRPQVDRPDLVDRVDV